MSPRLVTGNFTDKIIHATWLVSPLTTGIVTTGDARTSFVMPARGVLLAYDETTGTALVQGSLTADADTTGVSFCLRNTNTTGTDLLATNVTITSARYAQDGILITTQSSLTIDKGDVLNIDVDTANTQSGGLLVQAYFYGV